ncbi:hypothetical protein [Nonomuraea recticatena]|uniref:hypothetical protein n=1 Tax=Nonomuraea recticatena TaxID=46178 RepID=UPI00361BE39A
MALADAEVARHVGHARGRPLLVAYGGRRETESLPTAASSSPACDRSAGEHEARRPSSASSISADSSPGLSFMRSASRSARAPHSSRSGTTRSTSSLTGTPSAALAQPGRSRTVTHRESTFGVR